MLYKTVIALCISRVLTTFDDDDDDDDDDDASRLQLYLLYVYEGFSCRVV